MKNIGADVTQRPENLIGSGAGGSVYAAGCDCIKVMETEKKLSGKDRALINLFGPAYAAQIHQALHERFENEAAIMEELKGDLHIVQIKDHESYVDPETGCRTMAIRMERLIPLHEYLQTHDAEPGLVIRLGMELCQALIACEEKQIIHQDIKIDNIFVTEDGTFKLGDFGIAFHCNEKSTSTTSGGTISTMAPEVFAGNSASFSSDLYSLGMVMYTLMNDGLEPYICSEEEQNDPECRYLALGKRMNSVLLPPPSQAEKHLADVIVRACSGRAEDRYQSAQEMLQALTAAEYAAAA